MTSTKARANFFLNFGRGGGFFSCNLIFLHSIIDIKCLNFFSFRLFHATRKKQTGKGRRPRQAPSVRLLITSREVLNLGEEWPYEVHGLDYPGVEDMEMVDKFSAMALFVQQTRRVRPNFEMDTENRKSIARLCRLVEGMPLAIELAASWGRISSAEEIVTELGHDLVS